MGLDIQLAGEPGVGTFASIEQPEHATLMHVAFEKGLRMLQRLSDYYADAAFSEPELPELDAELAKAEALLSPEATEFVSALRRLILHARNAKVGIEAYAD